MRFVSTGTEAVMFAIKAARAFTGRFKIAKIEGCYHGAYDHAEVSQASTPDNWGDPDEPARLLNYKGAPPSLRDDVVVLRFNDAEGCRRLLNKHASELAAVLIDPMPSRAGLIAPEPAFVAALQETCRRHGILVISDEVLNFRQGYEGAAFRYGLEPDLFSLGKIIGGGLPIGAIAGRAEVMKVFAAEGGRARLPQGGTFAANPLSMVAGVAAMQALDRDAFERLDQLGDAVRDRLTTGDRGAAGAVLRRRRRIAVSHSSQAPRAAGFPPKLHVRDRDKSHARAVAVLPARGGQSPRRSRGMPVDCNGRRGSRSRGVHVRTLSRGEGGPGRRTEPMKPEEERMQSRRDFCRLTFAGMTALPMLSTLGPSAAFAQGRGNTLRIAWPYDTASLDAVGVGAQRSTWCVSLHLYDRLVTYEAISAADGTRQYDPATPKGELAERWDISADSKTITFHLRPGAKFHDGSPVTAEDVRWSIERSLNVKGAAGVMAVGALRSADQLKVVNDKTFQVTLPAPNRFAVAVFSIPFAAIINSKVARQNATAQDPWANEWLKRNAAGGGAYKVESFRNDQVVLSRNDDWISGPKPDLQQVIFQTVPEAATRAALVERGAADIALEIPPNDFAGVAERGGGARDRGPDAQSYGFHRHELAGRAVQRRSDPSGGRLRASLRADLPERLPRARCGSLRWQG